MPYSEDFFDEDIQNLILKWGYKSFLDIGAGAGKYGKMIREMIPNANITGIEIDSEYINKFDLDGKYDRLLNTNIITFIRDNPGFVTDVVIIGDLIEHLPKSEGIDLINYLVYRTAKIIVVYPRKYIQYDIDNKSHEVHRSVWSANDFINFEFEIKERNFISMIVVNGYLIDKEAIIKPYG